MWFEPEHSFIGFRASVLPRSLVFEFHPSGPTSVKLLCCEPQRRTGSHRPLAEIRRHKSAEPRLATEVRQSMQENPGRNTVET